ncbi:glycine N-acyltransferase-like [Glandiceps talaboti]
MDISRDLKSLKLLLSHLEDRQPESLPMYNLVRHVIEKKWDNTQVFVDDSNMQNCTTVLCHSPSTTTESIDDGAWYIYSEDEERLKSNLHKVKVAEGRRLDGSFHTRSIIFEDFDDKLLKTISDYMSSHGFEVVKDFTGRLHAGTLDTDSVTSVQFTSPVPQKGYAVASLKPEHAGLVASKNKFCSPDSIPLVRKMIEEFPSCAVYVSGREDPISWLLLQHHGLLGFGYTLPEYRSKKFLQMHGEMASRLPQYGYQACFSTADDNAPAQRAIQNSPAYGIIPLYRIHRTFFKKAKQTSKL